MAVQIAHEQVNSSSEELLLGVQNMLEPFAQYQEGYAYDREGDRFIALSGKVGTVSLSFSADSISQVTCSGEWGIDLSVNFRNRSGLYVLPVPLTTPGGLAVRFSEDIGTSSLYKPYRWFDGGLTLRNQGKNDRPYADIWRVSEHVRAVIASGESGRSLRSV